MQTKDLVPELESLYEKAEWHNLLEKSSVAPEKPEVVYYKALAHQELKQFEKALELYFSIYNSRSLIHEIDYNIGLCYYHSQEIPKAIQYLRKYLSANPKHPNIYSHLVIMLNESGRVSEINEVCEKALVWKVNKVPYKTWIKALIQLDRYKCAHEKVMYVLRLKQEDWEVWDILGDILATCGYYYHSRLAYEKAYKLNPNSQKTKQKIDTILKDFLDFKAPKIKLEPPILPPNEETKSSRGCEDFFCRLF